MQLRSDNGIDFIGAEGVCVLIIDPMEYRAVIKFLEIKGRILKKTFDEIIEVYGDDTPYHMM